jgi:hypothetical protein
MFHCKDSGAYIVVLLYVITDEVSKLIQDNIYFWMLKIVVPIIKKIYMQFSPAIGCQTKSPSSLQCYSTWTCLSKLSET